MTPNRLSRSLVFHLRGCTVVLTKNADAPHAKTCKDMRLQKVCSRINCARKAHQVLQESW
ncbi:hypothetical protein PISMIDRAFT_475164 [Pisolithus microcarpus 441]|uniref:Uncharacterized protein n=1 Tax=Pisolithus microcarpus 441 TaxID=765257 RepID=A0A0C9YND2_9AGAM|nr:hypothetical protein PISMIDRAFT_475164 [Pisolithus microcarpus 441]